MMKKIIRVILSEEANKQYEELNRIVGEELKKGIANSIHQQLLKSIKQKSELLKINPQAGIHIPKKLIPKIYIEITNFVLDFLDHATYDKIFGYRKK